MGDEREGSIIPHTLLAHTRSTIIRQGTKQDGGSGSTTSSPVDPLQASPALSAPFIASRSADKYSTSSLTKKILVTLAVLKNFPFLCFPFLQVNKKDLSPLLCAAFARVHASSLPVFSSIFQPCLRLIPPYPPSGLAEDLPLHMRF